MLPGTRPRKRRRGPFGPWVEKSSASAPSGRSRRRDLPRRALQAWLHRHRAIRRRSASRTRPVAACGSNILARNRGRASGSRAGSVCSCPCSTLHCGPIAIACTSRAAAKHELQPTLGPISPTLGTKNFLLQAVGASSISSLRTRTPHDGGGELDIGGSARCGGAYDRTRVRTRVDAGAWQGLQWRLKPPSPCSPLERDRQTALVKSRDS